MMTLWKKNFKDTIILTFLSLLLYLFCYLFLSPHSLAQTFPPKPSKIKFVNDFAGLYQPLESEILEQKLTNFNDKTSTQIAIVTIKTLDGYPIDDYTIKLANLWQIGQKDKNNGILILIAQEDHKIFIASGYGVEGALNDGKIGTIIRATIIPNFKLNNYFAGTNEGVNAIIAATKNEFKNDVIIAKGSFTDKIIVILIIIIFLMIIIFGRPDSSNESVFYDNNVKRFGGGKFGGGGAGGSW